MLTLLAIVWANPFFRKVAAVIGIVLLFVILVVSVRHHWIDLGQQQATIQVNQQDAKQDVAAVKVDRDDTIPKINALTVQINNLVQIANSQQQQLNTLSITRQQTQQVVAGMTPDQVQAQINVALNKPIGSTEFTIEDKRKALDCFQQLPQCNQQVATSAAIIKLDDDANTKQDLRYNLLQGYTGRVEQTMVVLANKLQQPKRRAKCLWFCKRPDKIEGFDPKQLLAEKPK